VSTPATSVLHGAQLGLVLPEAAADVEPRFEHFAPPVVTVADGVRAQVFVGSLFGSSSPVRVESPLVGAEVVLEPGSAVSVPVPEGFELSVLVDTGSVALDGTDVARAELAVVEARSHAGTVLLSSDEGARVLVLGGAPLGEEVVMWWNFIGRSHEEVVAAREAWEAGASGSADARFGQVTGYEGEVARIPAPVIPGVHLRPRGNRDRRGGFSGSEAPPLS
jgi:redox-sensitive bicupin YhaK (pirin superfamily)